METIVLVVAAIGSGVILLLRLRARTLFVIFLHTLVSLTVGSLTIRTLSTGGTLLIPFVEGWHYSPYMHLDSTRVYIMLAISFCTLLLVGMVKVWAHNAWTVSDTVASTVLTSPYACLVIFWIHLGTIVSMLLIR